MYTRTIYVKTSYIWPLGICSCIQLHAVTVKIPTNTCISFDCSIRVYQTSVTCLVTPPDHPSFYSSGKFISLQNIIKGNAF